MENVEKIPIEEMFVKYPRFGYPHIFENIFNELDNTSLTNCRKVSEEWKNFLDNEKFSCLRRIKKYGTNMVEFRNQWNKVIKKSPSQEIIELSGAVEHFFTLSSSTLTKQYSPLHIAARNGYFDLCQRIMEKTGNSNPRRRDGFTALHTAAQEDHLKVCELIVEKSADKNPETHNRFTPLHYAGRSGHFEVCRLIFQNIVAKNPAANNGITPLHCAAVGGHLEILKLLLDNGVDKRPLFNGCTPLQYAAHNCKWRCSMFLCEFNLQDVVQFLVAAWYSPSPEFGIFVALFGIIFVILLGCILGRLSLGILTLIS